jgi:carboxyl-terminal processing protease
MTHFLSKKTASLMTVTLLGLLLISLTGSGKPFSAFSPTAEANFFSNDLELFEEVVDLVGEKYIYPPDYRKMFMASIQEMVKTLDDENTMITDNPDGQSISRFDATIQYRLNFNRQHDLEAFKKAYYFLLGASEKKLSKSELEAAAVTGLMNSLDPYSRYMDADVFERSMRDTEGKYGGLGMIITMKDNRLYVLKTMKNSPAQHAGILPGDVFEKVNGVNINKIQVSELADMLRGYPGTEVVISLYRFSDKRKRTYTLTRKMIFIETVEYETLKNNIGSIKINSFSKQTNDQLKTALTKAMQDKVKGFIIDLRDNPGGLLDQSVKVASHFLHHNRLIVYTQRRGHTDQKYRAKNNNNLHLMPVVILINQYSASAAEIVAGALKDSGKALIIGENSYGKGTVQTIFRTSDGSGLRLTTSKYYTPSGTDITEQGIVPEIHIIKDHLSNNDSPQSSEKSKIEPLEHNLGSLIKLRESEVKSFINKNYNVIAESTDPTFQFAKILIENVSVANKNKTLEKARELAANIHY